MDCYDRSDEACGCEDYCTGDSEFKCDNNYCMRFYGGNPKCDGVYQGPDQSDELNCANEKPNGIISILS